MIVFSCRFATLLFAVAIGGALTARADIAGFGTGTGFTLNGGATINSGTATLTTFDGSSTPASQSRSVFFNTPQQVGLFSATFTYQDVTGNGGEGFVFTLQNDTRGATAVSNDGGQYGYGSSTSSTLAIKPSAAVEFNISQNGGGSKTGFATNGSVVVANLNATGSVNLASANPIRVNIVYDGALLKETLTDMTTGAVYTAPNVSVNLTSVLGASTALVGFTGGSGGTVSTQQVSAFTFAIPEPSEWALTLLSGAALLLAVRRTTRKA